MPPKFQALQVDVQTEANASEQSRFLSLNGSVRINPAGHIICMTDSYNAVMFSPEGMRDMSKKDSGEDYRIAERDVRVTKRLGAGASSTVFKGLYSKENKFVAIKRISVLDRDRRHQMLKDIKALIDMPNVPGLIQFYGAFHVQGSGQISIILEYMDGGSLADVLAKVKRIPEDVLSHLTAKILVGLMHLHKTKKMVHRDIKPANILVNLEGEPKITDFGISAFIDGTLAVCNTFLGTVTYMSPERIQGGGYGTPADIWSLGLVLLECGTGTYPYNAAVGPLPLMVQVMQEAVPIPADGFSAEFCDFVRQCMHHDPARRLTAEALLRHPYITKYADAPVDVAAFLQCVFDPLDKLEEVAAVVVWNYYAGRGGDAARLRKDLGSYYSERSVYTYEGCLVRGRQAILQLMGELAEQRGGAKATYAAQNIDCQPLGTDGSLLIHVQGQCKTAGLAGAAAVVASFSEVFIFTQTKPGSYFISSQTFRFIS